ncbi:MAG TPA: RdgB/HAM1 family non-canonical purine NTP pyrophosphatase [bacterium]|nr:RdgB/HAM1 family non-canonical purine NTP pyrophosphatase [bacterium]
MKTLYIASKNAHKVREIAQMLQHLALTVKSLITFPDYISPEETGASFIENARIKALSLKTYLEQRQITACVLADDSGLSCDGLGGLPGVASARFAGPQAHDTENNEKLVLAFSTNPTLNRSAYYTCALVLLLPDGTQKEIEEHCCGEIQTQAKGKNGFGYDPYFFIKDYQLTMAELAPDEKNRISHRGKALRKLLEHLSQIC